MTLPEPVENAIDSICHALSILPFEAFQSLFMQRAAVALLLLAPLCATAGIQVVNFRLAFFADAVSHSAFTGLGLGLLASTFIAAVSPDQAPLFMFGFGVFVALAITYYRRQSGLSSDTIIGIFSSSAVALGLCLVSGNKRLSGEGATLLRFLQGSALTVQPLDLLVLFAFGIVAVVFVAAAYNRLLLIGLNPDLARTMDVPVEAYESAFAVLLALLVMFCIPIVGALVVTAMLVIPAAAARNFARSAGSVFWWGLVIAWTSSLAGLTLSWKLDSSLGATVVLCSAVWFVLSQVVAAVRRNR